MMYWPAMFDLKGRLVSWGKGGYCYNLSLVLITVVSFCVIGQCSDCATSTKVQLDLKGSLVNCWKAICDWLACHQGKIAIFIPASCYWNCEESLYSSQVIHPVRAYPGFHSMKQLGVFPLHHKVTPSPPPLPSAFHQATLTICQSSF